AYNESRLLPACLYSVKAQTRPPDDILVINNASTDQTAAVARAVPGVRVVDEPRKGLVLARETGRRAAVSDVLAFLDADCRAPITWIERIEARFAQLRFVAVTGPYRFYDWNLGTALPRDRHVGALSTVQPEFLAGAAAAQAGRRQACRRAGVTMPGYEPFLLCDFHVHTRWSDGRLSVREVIDLYGQTGHFDV